MRTIKTMLVAVLCVVMFFSAINCSKKNIQDLPKDEVEFVDSVSKCLGPYGGRIDNILISNHDARIYLASSGSHAFISYDAGELWKLIPISTSRISSFEFDPENKDIFYIQDQDNIWETIDFGKTWITMPLPDSIRKPFYSFNVDKKTKYVSSASGLFKKTSEEKWENVFVCEEGEAPLESVSFSSKNHSLIAGIAGGRNVFVSSDSGSTWNGTKAETFNNNVLLDIKINPLDYSKIFVLYPGGVFFSSDNGLTWENNTEEKLPITAYQLNISSTGVLYVCTQEGVWQSINQGVSWNFISGLHDATYSITTNISGQTILAGSAKGINLYSISTQNWVNKNFGISAIPVETVTYHPLENQQFVVSTLTDKNYQYFLPLNQWDEINSSIECKSIFGDKTNFKLWYGINKDKIFKSEDLKNEWIQYSEIPTQSPIQKIWENPTQLSHWIAGTAINGLKPGSGIIVSEDSGVNWNNSGEDLSELAITNVCFDAVDSNKMYCIGMTNFGVKSIYISTNGGINWKQIEEIQNVKNINCDSINSGYIWAVNGKGEVYFSKDSATSWEKLIDLKDITTEAKLKYPDGFKILNTGNEGELILHVYRGTFLISQDFGKNWIEIKNVPDFSYYDFITHIEKRNELYIASDVGLVRLTLDR